MNKIIVLIFPLALLGVSCSGSKEKAQQNARQHTDTIVMKEVADSMEQFVADSPMPKAAEELFDDFIFNFASNRQLQNARIVFPLKATIDGVVSYIPQKEWKPECFFMHQGFYTIIFENENQMSLMKDTDVRHVVIERIDIVNDEVMSYTFNRENQGWLLTSLSKSAVSNNVNSSFLNFYSKFATDSTFQIKSIANPLVFSGPDPDDDFCRMEGVLSPETWPAFAPDLPSDIIYNINYGQTYKANNMRLLIIRGIANGLEVEMTFKNDKGNWKLTKLST